MNSANTFSETILWICARFFTATTITKCIDGVWFTHDDFRVGKWKHATSEKLTRWESFLLTFLTRHGCVADNYARCKAHIHSGCYFEIATGFNSSLENGCLKTELDVWINNCFIYSISRESAQSTKKSRPTRQDKNSMPAGTILYNLYIIVCFTAWLLLLFLDQHARSHYIVKWQRKL